MIRCFAMLFAALLLSWCGATAQEEKDIEGGQDHALLSRMPGYYLSASEVKDFDSFESPYLSGKDARWEGKLTRLGYTRKTGSKDVSMTQIARNYENAIVKLGGKVLYKDNVRIVNGRIEKGGAVTYVQLAAFNEGRDYELVVVESQPMTQEVTSDAAALGQSLASTGKAALSGIFFDTDKAVVKLESNPALEEVAKLLKGNGRLKLYVVGHTDNAGTLEHNLKLSSDRAEAVVKALVGRGIEATRLKSAGVGPYSPNAPNKTDEGKAKNRRVELVEQ
jgi:outer membrane protein OmpA-like peptidoglycan-associated protein